MSNFQYGLIGFCSVLAYLLGSVPTALWYGTKYYGIDIREHGSGNTGATNTFRTLGKKAGSFVFLIDVYKGFISASLALMLNYLGYLEDDQRIWFKLLFGGLAVIGHIFPIYINFRGGKGVATLFGMMLSAHPEGAMVCLFIFVICLQVSHYVSLSSMVSCLSFPLMLIFEVFGHTEKIVLVIFSSILALTVVYTHRININRLLKGTESKIYFFKRKKS